MKWILNLSTRTLVRACAVLCLLCFMFLLGCNQSTSSCEITVSGAGSLCQIEYTDNDGVQHNVIIQSDSDVITLDDCDEVSSVNCS